MSRLSVLLVVTDTAGGGAELIVSQLALRGSNDVRYRVVYLRNSVCRTLAPNEVCINMRSLINPISLIKAAITIRRYTYTEYSILHAHLVHPLYLCALLPVRKGTLKVFTEHNTWNRRRNCGIMRLVERFIYSRYHKIACISPAVQNALIEWLGPKLRATSRVVENGARTYPFKLRPRYSGETRKGMTGLIVGSLTNQKNHRFAIKLVASCDREIERMYFVGDGPLRANLEEYSRELGVSEKINFEGYQADIEHYLYEADFGLLPSHWEGFGLVVIEKISSGLPTLVSKVSGVTDLVDGLAASKALSTDDLDGWIREIKYLSKPESKISDDLKSDSTKISMMDVGKMVNDYENWYVS